ncbi:MAG: transposase [Euryarchaeota archaeon]|nr:transposase [Euryarchaeota archaeon]MBU4607866.1 transposase [Euryarchaeota archaeon]MBV1729321.1 transposase [Methanobacterium sp.]MBV1754149.1 transposase [Methanobacterium sp.]MBV1766914.1 transposase [Methanobacterium sp.]
MEYLGRKELIKFTLVAFKVAEMSLPAYSCENSKQTYTQHQLMALLCLMKRLRLRYCEMVEVIKLMPKLQELIGLKEIPHFTTLQKFFKRFGSHFFNEMLEQTIELFDIKKPWVAIDGTGHSQDHASTHYAKKN